MKVEIKSFTEEMIPQAGELLALRHKRNRTSLPLLPARFEDTAAAVKAVEDLWRKKFKNGYAAFHDGKMAAYLLGDFTVQSWGRCGYVYLPGYAIAEGENADIIQDLYALLGDEWNKEGCFNHYAYTSAADVDMLDAWFLLGFGKERVDAMMDLRALKIPEHKIPQDIEIRPAGKGDNDHLASMATLISEHYAKAPRWHPLVPEELPELREGWAELADDEAWHVWLALDGSETLSTIGYKAYEEEADNLLAPRLCAHMSVAATKESARGRGISTALTWLSLEETHKSGNDYCHTDWQTANLLASRFWPRFGFKPVAYRLARTINPMIAWAKGY